MVRELGPPMPLANDSRRLEIVADGLPLFGGAQLAVDMALVSSLHCDGTPHRGAATLTAPSAPGRGKGKKPLPRVGGPWCQWAFGGLGW